MDYNSIIQRLANGKVSVEILLTFLVIVSAVLNFYRVSGSQEALMITMSLLSSFYFISAYFPSETKGILALIAIKVIGVASAVCITGLLFAILHLVGASQMLLIAVTSLVGTLLILLHQYFTAWAPSFMPLIIRAIALILIGGTSLLKLTESAAN
jgi:hypothetical protein